jgi:hypothetical protein
MPGCARVALYWVRAISFSLVSTHQRRHDHWQKAERRSFFFIVTPRASQAIEIATDEAQAWKAPHEKVALWVGYVPNLVWRWVTVSVEPILGCVRPHVVDLIVHGSPRQCGLPYAMTADVFIFSNPWCDTGAMRHYLNT